jgi:hypothetical protein
MHWPEGHRRIDYMIMAFYAMAFLVIWLIEIEQLVIADPRAFSYPLWPPRKLVDLTHWWGANFHEGLYIRPPWYQATIWVDVFFSGPVYLAGIYAVANRRPWIKYPAIIQASMLAVIVLISMYAEIYGTYGAGPRTVAALSMVPWLIVPLLIIWRMSQVKSAGPA